MKWHNSTSLYKISYRNRVMLGLIISLLTFIIIFKYWPAAAFMPDNIDRLVFDDKSLVLDEVIPTRQAAVPAMPPRPQMPVPVPNDEVIDVEIPVLDLGSELSLEPLGTGEHGTTGEGNAIVSSPQRPPRITRIMEPVMPEAAKKNGVIAEVYVTFLVGLNGRVEDLYISEIREYDAKKQNYKVVDRIGYGIMEATMEAAEQWQFRPAEEENKPVRAYTRQVFSFGF